MRRQRLSAAPLAGCRIDFAARFGGLHHRQKACAIAHAARNFGFISFARFVKEPLTAAPVVIRGEWLADT
jgi:hypothetical protein